MFKPIRASALAHSVLFAALLGSQARPSSAQQEAASPGPPPKTPAPAAMPQQMPAIRIQGNYINSVGSSDAASEGTVTSKLIQDRPTLRPAEVLEFVPGVIVTQHSGDGKANQYFLRGFNLDHGTDFATWVDGMPINMPTHAHGHGYSDLNWLIPELVDRLHYRKGPYAAEDGDFASAGSARIALIDAMPRGIASVTLGQDRYRRALVANSTTLPTGELLYALETGHNDGPWQTPERFRRYNGVLRHAFGEAGQRTTVTAMAYSARWTATDQIPQRAVDAGLNRYGSLDSTDGGRTERYSLSVNSTRRFGDGELRVGAYAIRSRLALYSNFTYLLENPSDLGPTASFGDQFEQAERRQVYGFAMRRTWNATLGGVDSVSTLGLQVRHDRLDPVGLYTTTERVRTGTTQESTVRQTSIGIHADTAVQWAPWLRSIVGARADRFGFDVSSSIDGNGGRRSASLVSPKLSLVVGPWEKTEYFVNLGTGFHSNDARGATARFAAKTGDPVERVTPLVRTKGAELGLRTEIVPGLQSSLALWELRLGSELVFVGDAGETEPSRASRRRGIEWNNRYRATSWLLLDADLALSRARFTDAEPTGNHVPGAIGRVASFGATVSDLGPWSGHLQLRHFGPRPLVEDNSQRSRPTTLAYLRFGYRVNPQVRVALDVFNLFDRKASDIDYYYASRLAGEPSGGVEDVHFHPVEPRRFRLSLTTEF